jgi:hypothetical protein
MDGINHQKLVVYYCLTHIIWISSTSRQDVRFEWELDWGNYPNSWQIFSSDW